MNDPWAQRVLPERIPLSSRQAVERQPELEHLRERLLQNLHSGIYTGGSHLPADVPSSGLQRDGVLHDISLDDNIESVNGAVIVSVPAWDPEAEAGALQVVRASPKMYGVQRYDFVSFQRPDRAARSFGQLRLLFRAKSMKSLDCSRTSEAAYRSFCLRANV